MNHGEARQPALPAEKEAEVRASLARQGTLPRAGRSVSVTRVGVHMLAGGQQTRCAALQGSLARAGGSA